jgi:hypothetical protein
MPFSVQKSLRLPGPVTIAEGGLCTHAWEMPLEIYHQYLIVCERVGQNLPIPTLTRFFRKYT